VLKIDGSQIVRHLFVCLFLVFLFSGCTTNPEMNDIINNQYEDIKIYSDSGAMYVGEWVGDEKSKLRPIKILEEGRILMCVPKKGSVNVNGKVYIQDGEMFFIFEGGTRYKIKSVDKESMLLDYYGDEYKYHAGIVPDKCLEAFKNFE